MRNARDERGEMCALVRAVEARAFAEPSFDHGDLRGGQRIVLLRHPVIGVSRDEQLEQLAFRRIAGRDGDGLARAGLEQQFKVVELVIALGLLRAVAGHALLREDRRDVALERQLNAACGERADEQEERGAK